jgi:hypothetical protein
MPLAVARRPLQRYTTGLDLVTASAPAIHMPPGTHALLVRLKQKASALQARLNVISARLDRIQQACTVGVIPSSTIP